VEAGKCTEDMVDAIDPTSASQAITDPETGEMLWMMDSGSETGRRGVIIFQQDP